MSNNCYNKNRHSCYKLSYHLVVVTKFRHKCIDTLILSRLKEISRNLFSKWRCDILEIEGESDHIHILFEAPPQIQLSKVINSYKTVTSRYIRKEFADHLKQFYWKPYFWSNSYLIITTGSATVDIIKQYIQSQNAPS